MSVKTNTYDVNYLIRCIPILLIIIPFSFRPLTAVAQEEAMVMDTLVFKIVVDGKQSGYITGLYGDEGCYVRIFEVLELLGYKYDANWQKHTFEGYLSSEDKNYTIHEDTLIVSGEPVALSNSMVWSEMNDLFVDKEFFKKVYDIDMKLNMNELAVMIHSPKSAPYRHADERQQKKMLFMQQRKRMELGKVDTLRRSLFDVSAIGYSVMPMVNLSENNNFNLSARGALYGELLRGSFGLSYTYSDNHYRKLWSNNLTFNWEKSNFNKKWFKTLLVDHRSPAILTSINGYATSATISNDYRKSFLDRTFTYEGQTQPNAEVEIYNNGQLIEYVMSDSLGNFRAEVPVNNTDNNITAVTYNSLGVRTGTEKMVYVPAGLLPKHRFIYKFTSGISDYGDVIIAPTVEYGMSSWLTLTLGNETVIRPSNGTTSIVIGGAKFLLYKNLRLDVQYIPTTSFSARLYGNILKWLSGNLLYEHYNKNQSAINTPLRDHIQFDVNGSFSGKIKGNYNAGINYYNYGSSNMLSAYAGGNVWRNNWLNSFYISMMGKNSRAYTLRSSYYFPKGWYNELAVEYRNFGNSVVLQNRLNYQLKNKITAFADVSYNFAGKSYYINLGMTWRLPFMNIRSGTITNGTSTSLYAEVSGSMLINDRRNISFSERQAVGTSLKVVLFVDANGNGKHDKGEPIIKSPKVILRTPAIERKVADGVIFADIPPNVPFKLIVPQQKLGDISWQLSQYERTMVLQSCQSKTIYVPVKVLTEISGMIYILKDNEKVGVPNIPVVITNISNGKQIIVNSDDWGSFINMGLTCGKYTVDLHPRVLEIGQLSKRDPDQKHILEIKPATEGKQMDEIDFELVKQL